MVVFDLFSQFSEDDIFVSSYFTANPNPNLAAAAAWGYIVGEVVITVLLVRLAVDIPRQATAGPVLWTAVVVLGD